MGGIADIRAKASSQLLNANKAGQGYSQNVANLLTADPYPVNDEDHIEQYNTNNTGEGTTYNGFTSQYTEENATLPNGFSGGFLLGNNFYRNSTDYSGTNAPKSTTKSLHNKFVVFALGAIQPNLNEQDKTTYNYTRHFDVQEKYNLNDSDKFEVIYDEGVINERINGKEGNAVKYLSNPIQMPTASNIIKNSRGEETDNIDSLATKPLTERLPYSYSDFLYCKYYGKVPNTNLITLRRFGQAVNDAAQNQYGQPLLPIAQALTYFGDGTDNKLSDILKINFSLNWKKIQSDYQDVNGNEVGLGSGLEALHIGGKALEYLGAMVAIGKMKSKDANGNPTQEAKDAYEWWSGKGKVDSDYQKKLYGTEGTYWNRVLGPVNVINETTRRDRGLSFENDMNIKFSYCLRMIDGVNPKVAMLDLIVNFLALTYTNARFWGGMMRYFPNYTDKQSVPLPNQEDIFELDGSDSEKFKDYYTKLLDLLPEQFRNSISANTILDNVTNMSNGSNIDTNFLTDFFTDAKNWLTNSVDNVEQLILMNVAAKTRPAKISVRSMLDGNPVGEWHLVIGNPLNPIAVMGNMIVKGCTINFNDTLGTDDFPTEVSFNVKISHARPRDTSDIESMFNLGMGKMSYSPITTLRSEMNSYGEDWDKTTFTAEDGEKSVSTSLVTNPVYQDKSNFNSVYSTNTKQMQDDDLNQNLYVKDRIESDWGSKYANSRNLSFLLNNTKLNF